MLKQKISAELRQVVERNTDGRSFKMIDGERVKVNFLIFYEMFDHAACQDSFARTARWMTMIVSGFCWRVALLR